MDRFADMQMFVKVVETASISAAADKLDVAKSAVSRRLAELEARLGVQLFQRTTRRMNLTDSGRSFYERCLRILADLDEAELAVSQQHGALSGKLRVALPLSFGLLHLEPIINAFATAHPEVEFDLDFNDRQIDLMQEGFDVAVRIATLSDSSLIARRMAVVRHMASASPAYLAQHGTPQTPQELANHVCLGYSNLATPEIWTYHDAKNNLGHVKVLLNMIANNGDFLCRAAIAGQGIVMQPTFYMADAICRGDLVPILCNYQWPELNAYALYPPTRHLSTRVRAFVDFLVEKLSGEPYWDVAIARHLPPTKKRKKAGSR